MSKKESRITVPGGELAVVDYGGTGPDVLLVHSVCLASVVWDDVAARLSAHAHVVAIDLRGHGQSSAEATDIEQITDDIAHLVLESGLHRPVLVGADVAGGFVAAVAARHPDGVGGVVVVDSPVVESQEQVREIVRTVGTDVIVDMLTERFGLGSVGPDAESLESFVAEHVRINRSDWLSAAPEEDSMRALLLRCIVTATDGSWVYRPTPETVHALTRNPDESAFRPGRELLAGIEAPVTVLTLTRGRNGSGGDAMARLAAARPNVRLVELDGDPQILYLDPGAVADEIHETVQLSRRAG